MKKSIAFIFAAFGLAVLPGAAKADTVNMGLIGVGTVVGTDHIYPYTVTVDGAVDGSSVNAYETVMCIDLANPTYVSETWAATPTVVTSSSSAVDLEQAFLFNQLLTNPGSYSTSDYQYAVWAIDDLSGVQADGEYSANVQALDALAVNMVTQGTNAGAYDSGQYVIYTVIDGSQTAGLPTPQDMMGSNPGYTPPPVTSPVPEPSSLVLFGSGLLGLAGIVRRKMLGA